MIEFEYKDVTYRLGYSRKTIAEMAKQGLNLSTSGSDEDGRKTTEEAANAQWDYWVLFRGSFLLNHANVSDDLCEEIYSHIGDKASLTKALLDEYVAFFTDIAGEKEVKNAISWKKA